MFRILVVDDDRNTRLLMQAILESEHYTVTLAEDGVQAMAMLEEEHVDLVVLDVMMPRMNGYEFTRELRAAHSELPILMVSARQMPADVKEGFLAGTDDFMVKPGQQITGFLGNQRKMPVITGKNDFVLAVEHHAFDGRGTDIKADAKGI